MKDLIGIDSAEDILREHVRKNLFVQSFYDEKKGWLFRYHPIFRDFLKAKSKARVSEEERHSLRNTGRGRTKVTVRYYDSNNNKSY